MNFGMLILRKINFDIIWYSVIYKFDSVWSSDFSSFAFMNVIILVINLLLWIEKGICCEDSTVEYGTAL